MATAELSNPISDIKLYYPPMVCPHCRQEVKRNPRWPKNLAGIFRKSAGVIGIRPSLRIKWTKGELKRYGERRWWNRPTAKRCNKKDNWRSTNSIRGMTLAGAWLDGNRSFAPTQWVYIQPPTLPPKMHAREPWRATETPKVAALYSCAKCDRGFQDQVSLYDHLQTGCWSYDDIDALPSGQIDWNQANEWLASAIYDRNDNDLGKLMIVMLRLLRDKCKSSRYVKGRQKSYFETSKPNRGRKGGRGEGNYGERMSVAIGTVYAEIEAARDNPHHALRTGDSLLKYDADRPSPVPKVAEPIIQQLGPEATDRDINIALKRAGLPKRIRKETLAAIHEYQGAEWGGELPPGLSKERKRHWSQDHQRRDIYWLCGRAETAIKNSEKADIQRGVVDVPDKDSHTRRSIKKRDVVRNFGFHYPTTKGELEIDAEGDLAFVESGRAPMFELDSRWKFSCGDEFLVPKKKRDRANAGGFVLRWDDITFWIAFDAGVITREGKPNLPKWIEQHFTIGNRQVLLMLWWRFTQKSIASCLKCDARRLSDYVFELENHCRELLYLFPIRKVANTKPATFGEHIALDALRTIGEVRHSGPSISMADVASIIEVRRTMRELVSRLDLRVVGDWFARFGRLVCHPAPAIEELLKPPITSVTE